MRHWVVLVLFLFALGTLRVVACGEEDRSCVDDQDCDDGNPCTEDRCISYDPDAPLTCEIVQRCWHSLVGDGTPCGSGQVCVLDVCRENLCKDVVCDDNNVCTDEACDYADGTCNFVPVWCDDGDPCTQDTCEPLQGCIFTTVEDGTGCGTIWGICLDGKCVASCDPTSEEEYQCPIKGLEFKVCCPGKGGCQDNCEFETCDGSEEEYQCPIKGLEHLFCCPYFDQCMPDCDFEH